MNYKIDKGLLLVSLFLIGLGVVQVYSSSFIYAVESYNDGLYFFRKQFFYALLGIVVLLATAYVPWKYFEKWGLLIWLLAGVGVTLTLVPGFAIKVGGAYRWLKFPFGLRFEPAELLKNSVPIMMAYFVVKEERIQKPFRKLLLFLFLAAPIVLLLRQPDFGSFVICSLSIFFILFVYGLRWRYIITGIAAALPVFYFLVVNVPYRYARIMGFLDPWADPEQKGFQVIQSMLSFHSGGLWGTGLGLGQGKLFFLPEAHNDFTLAVLGEEMGFIGFLFVILLYGFLVFRGFQMSTQIKDKFTQAVALGVTFVLAISVFTNVGVTLGLLPTKGLALPFLSYGGSSLVCTCFAMGLLINIDRQNQKKTKRKFSGIKF